jgi:superfamily II DNA or RNA helicase
MKNIKLFDYQEDMKERIEKALRLHRSVMAQMPTGTGKTVLLASVVESFLREHSNCNVWIVAHRRELVSQIRETIQRVFSKTHPSSLTLKGGSTAFPKPLSPQGTGDVTAPPRRSEPLRSKVGGPSKVSPDCAGWDRLGMSGASKVSPDCLSAGALKRASKVSPDCAGWDRLAATCLRPADGLAATSASSVNPASDMMPIKAVSIQWLAKHYDEIEEEPGMIVIDEAHHALAKTYKEMWERFPNAKFLGLTATPCRLNGKGFTDLFDVLVQSWSVPEFISKGRLATYDFVSIKSDGVTQRLIDSLQKRGADGDYQNKEMDMLLNKKPSIERLYRSLEEFGKNRKGIVYAINISHANAIAEFYREHGIVAVAIDSKTPSSLRKELIERFKYSSLFTFHSSL